MFRGYSYCALGIKVCSGGTRIVHWELKYVQGGTRIVHWELKYVQGVLVLCIGN